MPRSGITGSCGSNKNKCWGGCHKTRILTCCWWECKLVQPLWKAVWSFLKKGKRLFEMYKVSMKIYWCSLTVQRKKRRPKYVSRINTGGFQDGGYREEAESKPPIVKSWRDAGDTLCRHNH
jgi:hypothetical protein